MSKKEISLVIILDTINKIADERSEYWSSCLEDSKTKGQDLRNSIRMCFNDEIAALALSLKNQLIQEK